MTTDTKRDWDAERAALYQRWKTGDLSDKKKDNEFFRLLDQLYAERKLAKPNWMWEGMIKPQSEAEVMAEVNADWDCTSADGLDDDLFSGKLPPNATKQQVEENDKKIHAAIARQASKK